MMRFWRDGPLGSDPTPAADTRPQPQRVATARRPRTDSNATAISPRLRHAIDHLATTRPELSTATPIWAWQWGLVTVSLIALVAATAYDGRLTLEAILIALAIPFFCVVLLRLAALAVALSGPDADNDHRVADPIRDDELPTYSVLVPLYREAAVLPRLLEALAALDYPPEKLDILLILESADPETIRAVRQQKLPAHIRTVIVPNAAPRTKPKALNYALAETHGEMVVVFDAEDRPDTDQLRLAAAAFVDAASKSARADARPLGCVQATLNIYNPAESWLTRQFTLEYTALFDAILPALQYLRLPVPLGGTSNHFPRSVLDATGGWDPFNVTEDADLGIRLARHGYEVSVPRSTTWEEAPPRFAIWKGQRTRWLKGWMQTFLVHLRQPARLFRELGARGFIGLNVLMGGMLLSALVHPWFFVLAMSDALNGAMFAPTDGLWNEALWWLGMVNLVAGYLSGALIGAVAAHRRGHTGLVGYVLMMPAYWLLISFAAYRALWQLAVAPYLWEKTEHAAAARRPPA